MHLLVHPGGIDLKFIPVGGGIAIKEAPVNPLHGVILPEAGPDHQIIIGGSADSRTNLVTVSLGIDTNNVGVSSRRRVCAGENVPTIQKYLAVSLSPGHDKSAVGGSSKTRVGASINSCINEEFIGCRQTG